jgi:hypothetical protein
MPLHGAISKYSIHMLEELMLEDNSHFTEYNLRIVGHSLGGGISALLALFLRRKFPSARAIAFEPPGCTMSSNLADEVQDYVNSFITAADLVPRFSYSAMTNIRDIVLLNIARIKVSKYTIVDNWKIDQYGIDAVREFLHDVLYLPNDIPATEFLRQYVEFRHKTKLKQQETMSDGTLHRSNGLCIPGRIIGMMSPQHQQYQQGSGLDGLTGSFLVTQRHIVSTTSRQMKDCWGRASCCNAINNNDAIIDTTAAMGNVTKTICQEDNAVVNNNESVIPQHSSPTSSLLQQQQKQQHYGDKGIGSIPNDYNNDENDQNNEEEEQHCAAFWVGRDRCRRILLSPTLLDDHKTDVVRATIRSLTSSFRLVEPYHDAVVTVPGLTAAASGVVAAVAVAASATTIVDNQKSSSALSSSVIPNHQDYDEDNDNDEDGESIEITFEEYST